MSETVPKLSRCYFAQITKVQGDCPILIDLEDAETRKRFPISGLFGYWGAEEGDLVKITIEYVHHCKERIADGYPKL